MIVELKNYEYIPKKIMKFYWMKSTCFIEQKELIKICYNDYYKILIGMKEKIW